MNDHRTFDVAKLVQFSLPSDEKGMVTEISITEKQSIAIWGVRPGQNVPIHIHPDGQDTWIMIKGELTYFLGNGNKCIISAGHIDVAQHHEVHGALNESNDDAIFISIYSAPTLKVESANA